MKKTIMLLLCTLAIISLSGCGGSKEKKKEPNSKTSYLDLTTDNIEKFISIESFISEGMLDCGEKLEDACSTTGFYKKYSIYPLYDNVEFEDVKVSLDYEVVCYLESNVEETNTIKTHLDDIVLSGNGFYTHKEGELVSFDDNQKCFSEASDKIVVKEVNGKVKITEYEE